MRRPDDGNRAFVDLFIHLASPTESSRRVVPIDARDLGLLAGGDLAPAQRPFAAVLGCPDGRVPIELIFNEGPNDLFVVRVAGNTLGEDVRGSLQYALDHLGDILKLVVVLGHSGCGAVTAAVDVFLDPAGYLSLASKHAVRSVVDRLQVVVNAAARRLEAAFGSGIAGHPHHREACAAVAGLVAHLIDEYRAGAARLSW